MIKRISKFLETRFLVAFLLVAIVAPCQASAPGDLRLEREDKSDIEVFPESVFPHWVHRLNYRCDVCHDRLFEMKKGSTSISMEVINKGESCGMCHNGDVAFGTGVAHCATCHRAPSK